jgi:hypothetical protein
MGAKLGLGKAHQLLQPELIQGVLAAQGQGPEGLPARPRQLGRARLGIGAQLRRDRSGHRWRPAPATSCRPS